MNKLLVVLTILSFIFLSLGTSNALETYYNNKIPYSAFFNGHSAKPNKIKVQKVTKSGKAIQAVVPVNQAEEKVEQKGLEGK
jgi:hypothetical protein